MFCPICGKESKGICLECYLRRNPIIIKNFEIKICPFCGKILPETEEDEKNLNKIIKRNILCDGKIKIENITADYNYNEKFEKFMDLRIILLCQYNEEKFEKEYNLRVKVVKTPCKICSRLTGNYYEAVLQLRGDKEKIKNAIDRLDKKFISDIEELKEGTDVYLNSKNYGFSLVSGFANEGAIIKFSNKLFGIKDGQRVYRMYISIRFNDLNVNDKVKYKGKIYNVLKTGKFLICEDENGKKKQIPVKKCVKI